MKVEWILCNLCKWTRRSGEESGRRRYELGPNWRSKVWNYRFSTTTISSLSGGHTRLRLRPRGHEDKGSSTNAWQMICMNPKWVGRLLLEGSNEKYVGSRQKWDLVHPVPYARYEPDKLYFYCSYSCAIYHLHNGNLKTSSFSEISVFRGVTQTVLAQNSTIFRIFNFWGIS